MKSADNTQKGVGSWMRKMLFRLVRCPFVVVNYICAIVSNPNILILLLLLGIAFVGGTVYRHCSKEVGHASIFASYKEEQDLEAGTDFETQPHCLCCISQCFSKYLADLNKRCLAEKCREERQWSESFRWSLSRMFDYGAVLDSIRLGWSFNGLVATALFLFTWLIGGGGLVGSIITTMKYLQEGGWRRWSCLLWNHMVILGWNDNCMTIIREHIESQRFVFRSRRRAMPERIVIVTSRDVDEVKQKIRSFLRPSIFSHPTIRFNVYRGAYDDKQELKRLNLKHTNALYVLGEDDDKSHDARILMLPQVIDGLFNKKAAPVEEVDDGSRIDSTVAACMRDKKVVRLELHIMSFGLYCQQIRRALLQTDRCFESFRLGDRNCKVVYKNFYVSWSKRLFANCWSFSQSQSQSNNVCLRYGNDASSNIHLVIVGFSEMGQALALQAARVAHYGERIQTYITIFDDEIEQRETEFRSLFPHIDEIADIHLTFMHGEKIGTETFMDRIVDFSNRKDVLTVAIACDDSVIGMKVAIPINNKVQHKGGKRVQILLRQDIVGRVMPKNEEAPPLNSGMPDIRVFGMRDGAGYNAWIRDRLMSEFYSEMGGKEYSPMEEYLCETCFDALEETYDLISHDISDTPKATKTIGAITTAGLCIDDVSLQQDISLPVSIFRWVECHKDSGEWHHL